MQVWSPHTFHFFSESSSHLQFSLFLSRRASARCYACRKQSFRFEFGYFREIIPSLEHIIPQDREINWDSEVDFENFLWTQFYLRIFCTNLSCEFEGCVAWCETPLDLAHRLVELSELLGSFNFTFTAVWQAEIAAALGAHSRLFFGPHSEEPDLPPSVVVDAEFPDPDNV